MAKVFENISFNDVPQALSHLLDKMDKIEQLLTQTQKSSQPEEPQWMDLKQLQAWLPDHPAAPTVYGWVRNNLIPYHKKGKKLLFKRTDIEAWLEQSRIKTNAEMQEDAFAFINKRRIGK